jgi:ethanolamine transporter EutH
MNLLNIDLLLKFLILFALKDQGCKKLMLKSFFGKVVMVMVMVRLAVHSVEMVTATYKNVVANI